MRHNAHLAAVVLTGCLLLEVMTAAEPIVFADQQPTDPVAEQWLKLVEQGQALPTANVNPEDAVTLLAALKARIDKVLAEGNKHPAFDETVPTTLDDFEKLFWSMHVFSNQMTSAGRFFDYAQGLKKEAKRYKFKKNDKIDVSGLNANWSWAKIELGELRQRFIERDRDLRVARLTLAKKVLTESNDVAERLLAAQQLDMDGEALPPLLAKDKTFSAKQLQEVTDTIKEAREAAGAQFIQKARWLFTGLHWWVRGRYGMGTAGNGLLKSPAALKSAEAMFGLLMPIHTPIPTAPGSRESVPNVDRRHHYLWQFETRQVASAYAKNTTTNTQFTPVSGSVTTLTHFY